MDSLSERFAGDGLLEDMTEWRGGDLVGPSVKRAVKRPLSLHNYFIMSFVAPYIRTPKLQYTVRITQRNEKKQASQPSLSHTYWSTGRHTRFEHAIHAPACVASRGVPAVSIERAEAA